MTGTDETMNFQVTVLLTYRHSSWESAEVARTGSLSKAYLGGPLEEDLLLTLAEHRLLLIVLGLYELQKIKIVPSAIEPSPPTHIIARAVSPRIPNKESGISMAEVVIVGSRLGDIGVGGSEVAAVRLIGGDESGIRLGAIEIVEDFVVIANGEDG